MSRSWKTVYLSVLFLAAAGLALTLRPGARTQAQNGDEKRDFEAERQAYFARVEADVLAGQQNPDSPPMSATPCVGGFAGPYACSKVDLMAFMPITSVGGGGSDSVSDIWGWTDPQDGKEYALLGVSNGTSFIDISDPENPVYLGRLPTQTSSSTWRDIKVYNDYAFIVSEASGHGMQVFDLTRLRNVISPPVTFTTDALYTGFGNAHNIVINEASGYAYGVGTSTCSGGLHFINIQNPLSPTNAGCFSADGYTHDAQCVTYAGPDPDHQGAEVCFNANEDTLTIADVTNKGAPAQLSRTGYSGSAYTHQVWVTEDHLYLLLGDELDESNFGHNTRTRIWDISDLDNPSIIGIFDGPNASIDHNIYAFNGYAYESNYTSGLQILDLANISSGSLTMAAYFDVYTPNNSTSFNGTWSNYPFFSSGIVVVTGIDEGLFVLAPALAPDYKLDAAQNTLEVCVAGDAGTTISVIDKSGYTGTVALSAVGLPAGSSAAFAPGSVIVPGSSAMTVTVTSTGAGSYGFNVHGDDGSLQHDEAMTLDVFSGMPGAPVLLFPGNGATGVDPTVTFTWNPAGEASGYQFELATDSGFSNIVDSAAVTGTSYPVGTGLDPLSAYYWRVSGDNLCGTGSWSATFSFTTRDIPPILLVDDDDNNPDVLSTYTDALDALGWTYDIYDTGNSDNEPTSGELSIYDAVIWFSGVEFNNAAGPGAAGEAALSTWLDAGGCFFISSQDYRYDKGVTGFMTGYLGVVNVTNDDGNYTAVTGKNVFSGLGSYTLSYPFNDYSDTITVGNGGIQAMLGNNSNVGGASKETGLYKTTYWAFPWEALPQAGREASMQVFLDWCSLTGPPPTPTPSPTPTATATSTPTPPPTATPPPWTDFLFIPIAAREP